MVGTIRSNLIRDGGVDGYLDYYGLTDPNPGGSWAATSISSRLVIHPDFRGSPLAVRLACESFRWGISHGIRADFCDCSPVHVPFFTGLGYVVQFVDFDHPEFGLAVVLRLDLYDRNRLIETRSPFRRPLAAWLAGQFAA